MLEEWFEEWADQCKAYKFIDVEPKLREAVIAFKRTRRLEAEIEKLRAALKERDEALRPFAEAHQECVDNPSIDEPWARPEDFARAAELVPGD